MNAVIERPRMVQRLAYGFKLKPKEARAVEALGALNDRRTLALAAHDRQALIEIAWEYAVLGNHGGCPRMVSEILEEAEKCTQ